MPIVENRYFKASSNSIGVNYYMSGQNLLDNWDFTNPVNQRGQTSYGPASADYHCIDRWKGNGANRVTVDLINDNGTYLNVKFTGTGMAGIYQQPEFPFTLSNKVFTMSVEYKTNTNGYISVGNTGVPTIEKELISSEDFTIESVVLDFSNHDVVTVPYFAIFATESVSGISIRRVKLELGTISTLKYDAPMDYARELAKCQRFLFIPTAGISTGQVYLAHLICTNTSNIYGFIPTPVTMRTKPALATAIDPTMFVCVGSNGTGGSANRIPTSIIIPGTPNLSAQSIPIQATTDSLFAVGYHYLLYANAGIAGFTPLIFTSEL